MRREAALTLVLFSVSVLTFGQHQQPTRPVGKLKPPTSCEQVNAQLQRKAQAVIDAQDRTIKVQAERMKEQDELLGKLKLYIEKQDAHIKQQNESFDKLIKLSGEQAELHEKMKLTDNKLIEEGFAVGYDQGETAGYNKGFAAARGRYEVSGQWIIQSRATRVRCNVEVDYSSGTIYLSYCQ